MERGKKTDPDARLAMILLRSLHNWDQGELARAAGIAPSQVSIYDRGERALPRAILERIAAAAGFPLHLLDPLLRSLRSFRAAARGGSRPEGRMFDQLSAGLFELVAESLEAVTPAAPAGAGEGLDRLDRQRPPRAEDRAEAAVLWERMARLTPAQQRALVEEAEEFQSWALCERVAAESLAAAADDPRRALDLAELARRIAEAAPGTETWRRRLRGYAWAHVSRAKRVRGDVDGAGEALSAARELWKAGAPGDPGLLSPPELLGEADP
jgi:transcriptional regulator with XRE-family HTH domain